MDTETGELRTAARAEGAAGDVLDMEAELAEALFNGLGIDIPEKISSSRSASAAAAEAYYRGLVLFDSGEYEKAAEYYRRAAIEDPDYSKPREGLEASYRFLKDFRRMRQQREINKLLAEADVLRNRLQADEWISYGDFIMEAYRSGNTDNEALTRQAEEMGLLSGDTPAICTWNLQNKLFELANLSVEYFDDRELSGHAKKEIINLAVEARDRYSGDAFLPEIIYQELLAVYYEGAWEYSLALCEELMINYPEYRMMWAVEEFYEESLNNLE